MCFRGARNLPVKPPGSHTGKAKVGLAAVTLSTSHTGQAIPLDNSNTHNNNKNDNNNNNNKAKVPLSRVHVSYWPDHLHLLSDALNVTYYCFALVWRIMKQFC